jgi:hypothetical protein
LNDGLGVARERPGARMSDAPTLLTCLWYFVFPVWLLAGVGDYLCHRMTRIEETSGFPESLLHAVEAAELGLPLFLGLFLEINALVLLAMIAGVIAHTATALWDTSYADKRRRITPLEQHIHSYLEILPMGALGIAALSHWDAFQSLLGIGDAMADFGLRWKAEPIPPPKLALAIGLILVVQGLPLLEELRRTSRRMR